MIAVFFDRVAENNIYQGCLKQRFHQGSCDECHVEVGVLKCEGHLSLHLGRVELILAAVL
jgi:hypothetical protein